MFRVRASSTSASRRISDAVCLNSDNCFATWALLWFEVSAYAERTGAIKARAAIATRAIRSLFVDDIVSSSLGLARANVHLQGHTTRAFAVRRMPPQSLSY